MSWAFCNPSSSNAKNGPLEPRLRLLPVLLGTEIFRRMSEVLTGHEGICLRKPSSGVTRNPMDLLNSVDLRN